MFYVLIIYNIIINCIWGQIIFYDVYFVLVLIVLYVYYFFFVDDNIFYFQIFLNFFFVKVDFVLI